jgi:hypothetical protein
MTPAIVGIIIIVVVVVVIIGVVAAFGQSSDTRPSSVPSYGSYNSITGSLPAPPTPPSTTPAVVLSPRTKEAVIQARADIARRRVEVDAALASFQATGFEALTALHHQAFTTADVAHALYRSTQSSSRSVSGSIEQLDKYIKSLSVGVARADARYVASRNSSVLTRRQLVANAQSLQAQTAELKQGVVDLNHRTHTLKIRIRGECGQRGRDWYARLEARIRNA